MYRVIAFILTGVMLFQMSFFEIENLAQLDELIEHAKFHKEQYGDNFFVFLEKHYGDLKQQHERDHKEEKEDHEKLPFNHQTCAHSSLVFVVNSTELLLPKVVPLVDSSSNFYYKEPSSSFEKPDVFQPPKNA